MSGKKLLIVCLVVALLIAIPLGLYFYSQQQPKKSHTVATTKLEFSPATGIKKVNDQLEFKIKVDPGSNAVSFVSLDISYDPTKFEAANNALTIDKTVMPLVLQGPVYTAGRIRVNLSTGNDASSALTKPAILGSLLLKAIGSTNGATTNVSFGSSTQILSVSTSADSTDNSGENVLSSTTPAQIMIADAQPNQLVAAASPMPADEPAVQGAATETNSSPTPTAQLLADVISPTPTLPEVTTTSTPTPTPTKAITPIPTKTATPTPTTLKAVAGISDAPTPTDIPTITSAPTSTDTETPVPTLAATGPGLTYVEIGAFSFVILIAGVILLIAL